jgi:hypothetical protein
MDKSWFKTNEPRVCFSPSRDFFYMKTHFYLWYIFAGLGHEKCTDGLSIFHGISELVLAATEVDDICYFRMVIDQFLNLQRLTIIWKTEKWLWRGVGNKLPIARRDKLEKQLNEIVSDFRPQDPTHPDLVVLIKLDGSMHRSMWMMKE